MDANATTMLGREYVIPEEERASTRKAETFPALVARLSRQSVVKHFDAYADIAWDSEEFRIDPADPRWELTEDDVLGATSWYRSLPQPARAQLGLHMDATFMKIGLEFEGVLKRGLLEFAATLPNGAPEFRYAYHEVIEEAQHSLMFQEFVNRTGFDTPGMSPVLRFLGNRVTQLGRRFPELFFVFVLGGEDPIDHVQRTLLRGGREIHPLLRRVMQIHVTEEARHLCFARHYLKEHVPSLGPLRKLALAVQAPIILGIMAQIMLRPSAHLVRAYRIPPAVIAEAYGKNPRHRTKTLESLRKVRVLCDELGIVTPLTARLWRMLGIWETAPAAA
jgi:hypothetical protein